MTIIYLRKPELTEEILNRNYGMFGRTFKDKSEAKDFQKEWANSNIPSYITRIIDYHPNDVVLNDIGFGVKPKSRAIPKCQGYLVTRLNNEFRQCVKK